MTNSADRLVAVTGATGYVGGAVAARLADRGVRQRLVVRDPGRAPTHAGAQVAVATFDDGDALRTAFASADTVLFVSAAEHPDRVRQHLTVVEAAAAAGVRRVVYTSFLGNAPHATFTLARHHWRTEEALRESGLTFTFLRDSIYLDFLPMMVGEDGVIRGPADAGLVAPVARDDVADVATAVIVDESGVHDDRAYDVTGARLATVAEWAAELAAVTGRDVTFHDETLEEAWASRARYGAPDWMVEGWISTYRAIAAGELEAVSDTVQSVAGHPPRTLRDLLGAGERRLGR